VTGISSDELRKSRFLASDLQLPVQTIMMKMMLQGDIKRDLNLKYRDRDS
jgi:hypothetical protein